MSQSWGGVCKSRLWLCQDFCWEQAWSQKMSRKVLLRWLFSQCELLLLYEDPRIISTSEDLPALAFKQTSSSISVGILLIVHSMGQCHTCSTCAKEELLMLWSSGPTLWIFLLTAEFLQLWGKVKWWVNMCSITAYSMPFAGGKKQWAEKLNEDNWTRISCFDFE